MVSDLTPQNVEAVVLGPTAVLVKWSQPRGGDQLIQNYKVFQRYRQLFWYTPNQ